MVREFVPMKTFTSNMSTREDLPPETGEGEEAFQPWERKAAEIEARTRELRKREAQLRPSPSTMLNSTPLKNWPPFFPLIYHDVEAELPGNCQDIAKRSYFIWQVTAAAYALNFLATVMMLFSGVNEYSSLVGTVFAGVYVVLFPALAFFSWHMSLYKALKFDSSFWFILYFVTFGIQMLIYAFLAVGLFNGGGGGILGMLAMLANRKIIAAILSALCTAAMAFCLFMSVVLIKQVNDHFRTSGHSVERAGAEAGRNIAQNDTVRRSTKDAVLSAV